MRVPVWMLFGLIISILLMDLATVFVVRAEMIEAVNMALDAAFVAGINEEDLSKGKNILDETKAYNAALTYFKKNLNLDGNLENKFLKNTKFVPVFKQDKTNSAKSMAVVTVSTTVSTMVPKLVGAEGIDITIRKKQYFMSSYR